MLLMSPTTALILAVVLLVVSAVTMIVRALMR
jgi:hypothetical protein